MTEPDKPPLKPWQYLTKKWVREESFWREMTTRTFSALLATAVVGLALLLSGFGTHDQRMMIIKTVLFFIASCAVGIPVLLGIIFLLERYTPQRMTVIPSFTGAHFTKGRGILANKVKVITVRPKEAMDLWSKNRDVSVQTFINYTKQNPDVDKLTVSYQAPDR